MYSSQQVIDERSKIIPIKKNLSTSMKDFSNIQNEYSLKQNFFDPTKSSPPNDFMLKLQIRMKSYNSSDNLYDVAYIPDYKTSVMMNKLFRNIKENANLDALEESDDEAEFENESPDKFVHLDRSYNMTCIYNLKFRKWTPVRVAPKGERIITKNILYCN